jgi:tRNA threonylcarbamoyl adenosine modification protein YjeE
MEADIAGLHVVEIQALEMITLDLPDEAATAALATRVAALAKSGDVIALKGNLGAGKTAFARAFIRSRSGNAETQVPSPTFTLVQVYDARPTAIWHFDFYRLRHPDEVWELGVEEAFADGISLIEWPEPAEGVLPPTRTLEIALLPGATPESRRAQISGGSEWEARLALFEAETVL